MLDLFLLWNQMPNIFLYKFVIFGGFLLFFVQVHEKPQKIIVLKPPIKQNWQQYQV